MVSSALAGAPVAAAAAAAVESLIKLLEVLLGPEVIKSLISRNVCLISILSLAHILKIVCFTYGLLISFIFIFCTLVPIKVLVPFLFLIGLVLWSDNDGPSGDDGDADDGACSDDINDDGACTNDISGGVVGDGDCGSGGGGDVGDCGDGDDDSDSGGGGDDGACDGGDSGGLVLFGGDDNGCGSDGDSGDDSDDDDGDEVDDDSGCGASVDDCGCNRG